METSPAVLRGELFGMADELDGAQVLVLVAAEAGECFRYTSSAVSANDVLDQYQRALGIDLWSEHCEKMEEDLARLKETNMSLRAQIGQRMGQSLDDLSLKELLNLEQEMRDSARFIRERKFHVLRNQIEIARKKLRRAFHFRHCYSRDIADTHDRMYGSVVNGGVHDYKNHLMNALPEQINGQNPNGMTESESCLTTDPNVSGQNLDDNNDSAFTPTSIYNPSDEDAHT